MTGWKSKWGAILMAIGSGLLAGSEAVSNPEISMWIRVASIVCGGIGASLLGIGVSHKIEKTNVNK